MRETASTLRRLFAETFVHRDLYSGGSAATTILLGADARRRH